MHWIDPTSLELLQQVLERVGGMRVFAVLTTRPIVRNDLSGYPRVTQLTLNRLGRQPSEDIIRRLAGARTLDPALEAEIVAKTDGMPLFLEEVTKSVLEEGGPARIPASLRDALTERLDRLGAAKPAAQMAACIGREFDHSLMSAVTDMPDEELQAALDRLVAAELVFRRGDPPEAIYSFKHALVRDAAYASLLKAKRREIHRCIVDILEADRLGWPAEIVAQHAADAGLAEKAIENWVRAATQATEQSHYAEAVSDLRHGLALLCKEPDVPGHDRQELAVRSALITPLIATEGYGANELEASVDRAAILAGRSMTVLFYSPRFMGSGSIAWRTLNIALASRSPASSSPLLGQRGHAPPG